MNAYTEIRVPKKISSFIIKKDISKMTQESKKPYLILKKFVALSDKISLDSELIDCYINILKEYRELNKQESFE